MNMTIVSPKLVGRLLYSIGALILIPAGAIFIASPNTLLMAGPIVLLLPIVGGAFALVGKWMTRRV
jgi:hypothetical protein